MDINPDPGLAKRIHQRTGNCAVSHILPAMGTGSDNEQADKLRPAMKGEHHVFKEKECNVGTRKLRF